MRLAISGAAVEREILRQDVQQHAIALQPHVGGELDGVARSSGVHFARPCRIRKARGLRAVDAHAADRRSVTASTETCAPRSASATAARIDSASAS